VREAATPPVLTLQERILYHQIHPAKLLTDWSTAIGAAWLLWDHRLLPALLIGLLPPVVVTLLIIRGVDLTPYRDSPFGRYLLRHMTRSMELVRLVGLGVAWAGAWVHSAAFISLGVAVILAAWGRGLKSLAERAGE
jgi:hypothetical protein